MGRGGGAQRAEGRGGGGWKPVLRKRWRGGAQRASIMSGLVTIFVDDIPEMMSPQGLFKLFSKFGVVKDVFIPAKRRLVTGSRFGFVRYNCPILVELAVQKTNGVWCEETRLKVKMAEYNKMVQREKGKEEPSLVLGKEKWHEQPRKEGRGQKSYVEVVAGKTDLGSDAITVMVKEEGNGWLGDSVIVKLKTFFSFHDFKEEVNRRGMKEVLVREGSGRLAVFSISSVRALQEGNVSLQDWVYEWCDSVSEWRSGFYEDQERCVWIYCFGVPLNLWNVNTFKSIGRVWGEVVHLDDDTTRTNSFQYGRVRVVTKSMENINKVIYLGCDGSLVPVRVCEAMEIPMPDLSCSSISINTKKDTTEEVDQFSSNGVFRRGGCSGGEARVYGEVGVAEQVACEVEKSIGDLNDEGECNDSMLESVVKNTDMELGVPTAGGCSKELEVEGGQIHGWKRGAVCAG
ncbi:uncharacterized protein LOC114261350 [Camellia sinensis]|uniref:uncharacterized protein LOC114261350 n=1 Tax=Camellia sinensis TaxID=4442 RepID=UPI001036B4E6|nr:uncharacterized protein LOC114261350 [Camellia sinensis]